MFTLLRSATAVLCGLLLLFDIPSCCVFDLDHDLDRSEMYPIAADLTLTDTGDSFQKRQAHIS